MSNQKFASKTKFNYYRGLRNVSSQQQLSNIKFRLFSNQPMLNWIENKIKNEVKPSPPVPPVPPEPTYNNKMVAIFSPSTLSSDQLRIDSIKYLWTVVPDFEPFLILEYDGTQEDLIKTLNKAYNLGKRYIYGFSTSSSLLNSFEWLNQHPDVQGVTNTAASNVLAVPKKIYRAAPDLNIQFSTIQYNIFNGAEAIYYIYNSTQLISNSFKSQLLKYCDIYDVSFNEYSYSNLDDITEPNIKNTILDIYNDMSSNSYTKSSICLSMVDFAEEFYKLFNSGMADVSSLGASYFELNGYNIISNSPSASKEYFNNILYISGADTLNPSKLQYSTPQGKGGSLDPLNILYQLNNYNGYMNEIGIYSYSYILDPITRDNVAYPTIFLNQYQLSINKFKEISIIYKDINGDEFECILPV